MAIVQLMWCCTGVELDCLANYGLLRGSAAAVVPSIVTASQLLWQGVVVLSGHS